MTATDLRREIRAATTNGQLGLRDAATLRALVREGELRRAAILLHRLTGTGTGT